MLDQAGAMVSEQYTSAYGVELFSTGAPWPLHGMHGSEPDQAMAVSHFGARHISLDGSGQWMQREPLLYTGLTGGDLASPRFYGGAYAAGNTNVWGDPSGENAMVLAPTTSPLGAAAAAQGAIDLALRPAVIHGINRYMALNHPGVNAGAVGSSILSRLQQAGPPSFAESDKFAIAWNSLDRVHASEGAGPWLGNNTKPQGTKTGGKTAGYQQGVSDITGAEGQSAGEAASGAFEDLTGKTPNMGDGTSKAPTDTYSEPGIDVSIRPTSKSGTPVITVTDHDNQTTEKIHVNPAK